MIGQAEVAIEVLTPQGWYRGYLLLPAGGRLLDYLNTKPAMIGLTGVSDPTGAYRGAVAINTERILAMRIGGEG